MADDKEETAKSGFFFEEGLTGIEPRRESGLPAGRQGIALQFSVLEGAGGRLLLLPNKKIKKFRIDRNWKGLK
ncbi:MAG: hypothetical protein KGJ13_03750 [Patescibacteria group bacterium]|nr:hypothetical protein [Patescibacteria group bacterium]